MSYAHNLRSLTLSGNDLGQVAWHFRATPALEIVELQHCLLTQDSRLSFSSNQRLHTLDLRYNKLNSFNGLELPPHRLRCVLVAHNPLSSLQMWQICFRHVIGRDRSVMKLPSPELIQ